MFYDTCAGCDRSLDGMDVVLVDARPLCPTCVQAARAQSGATSINTSNTVATGINTSTMVGNAAAVESGERPRFEVRLSQETPRSRLAGFFTEAGEWSSGRMWWPRLLLLLWFASVFWALLRDPMAWVLIDGLNLGIHELGHYAFYWLGEFASLIGGSLLEIIAPIGAAVMFYRQRDYFAIAVASCWLGTALFNVGSYAGDARAQDLPLVSPTSSDPLHDWFHILRRLDLLEHDHVIMSLFHFAGATAMVGGLLFGGWLVLQMKNSRAG